ncbi:MAG: pilus assembly protein PilM [Desulfobulbus sp.]|jgi:type IV pilus assembly protein PilM|uniref:type IV pilus biogenesis protein PilM n=1 Tax=Desulfobulbus sp. TaxID=895 RepID=UPI00283B21FB|nr:type IV pilus assembly protein PilM [Desulfobulbus sp.]MDR2549665.1 pilus assembly protein PilM [Desulfobulbus sp.]
MKLNKIAKQEKLITGIDIGSYAVKVCQLKRVGDSYKIESLGSAALPAGAVEDGILHEPLEVSKVLSTLIKNLKIKNTKIGISISGHSVIVKKINLEQMTDDELAEYIKSEAEQYIPFDIDDVYIDFQKLPPKKDTVDRCDVMLVAAKKEVVNDYLEMLNGLKLNTVLVDVDGFALENIWETVSNRSENVALVDVGASKMNINIISGGVSVLARDVAAGSEQLTDKIMSSVGVEYADAENIKLGIIPPGENQEILENIFNRVCTQWVLEIKKAIDLYQANNPDRPLQSIALSGGGSKVNGFKEYLVNETGLEVVAFNPFDTMSYDRKKLDSHYISNVAPEMAIAAGLAIRSASF